MPIEIGVRLLLIILSGAVPTLLVLKDHDEIQPDVQIAIALACSPSLVAIGMWLFRSFDIVFAPLLLVLLLPFALFSKAVRRTEISSLWLIIVFLIQLLWVRELILPSNVDSVQHVGLIQAIRDTGHLPSELPDSDGSPLFYHFGVHYFIATILPQASDAFDTAKTVLLVGPVLLALTAAGVYAAARTMGASILTAIAGGVVGVFAFAMPAFLQDWGRYTLLFLLAPFVATVTLSCYRLKWRQALWAGALIAAVFVAHTRMLIVWPMLFVLVFVVKRYRSWLLAAVVPIPVGIWFFVRYIEWMRHVSAADWSSVPVSYLQTTADPPNLYLWHPVEVVWILATLVGLQISRSIRLTHKLILVSAILVPVVVALVPRLDFIPGGRVIDGTIVYAMVPLVVGVGIAIIGQHTMSHRPVAFLLGATLIVLLSAVMTHPSGEHRCCRLVEEGDIEAILWLGENPPGVVAIEGFVDIDQLVAGVDGGYWLSTLTEHEATVPSLFYGLAQADYQYSVFENHQTINKAIGGGDNLCSHNVSYVYSRTNSIMWSTSVLAQHPNLRLVFSNGVVSVHEVICS